MSENDTLRVRRLQELMVEAQFDCLVCRLPENVVYITEYWPVHGIFIAVLPKSGKPTLFIPEVEPVREGWSGCSFASPARMRTLILSHITSS